MTAPGQAHALNELGLLQQVTSDYVAADASHQQALRLYRDLGQRREQGEVLNSLGELVVPFRNQPAGPGSYHGQARWSSPVRSALLWRRARALEGIGRCHLQDRHASEGTALLQQALAIYQRIGATDAQRVQELLRTRS